MVEVNINRKAVEISWDTNLVEGETADIYTENADGTDVSSRTGVKNDGFATLTFPADYHGASNVQVVGSDGGEDVGTITV